MSTKKVAISDEEGYVDHRVPMTSPDHTPTLSGRDREASGECSRMGPTVVDETAVSGLRVLLIDDDAAIARSVARLFRLHDIRVDHLGTVAEEIGRAHV